MARLRRGIAFSLEFGLEPPHVGCYEDWSRHRECHQRIVRGKHRKQRAALDRIIHRVLRAFIGMMEIASHEFAVADDEVASEDVKIFRAGVDVGGIAHARIKFSEQHRIAALFFEREEFDKRPGDGQSFPAFRLR